MKYFFFLATLLVSFSSLHAQYNNMQTDPDKAIQLYLGIGGAYNDFKNLNSRLSAAGLPVPGRFLLAGMGEADLRYKNFIVGLSSGMGFNGKRNGGYNTSLMNYNGTLNVGYYIVNSKKFHLAPQAGIGFYSAHASITQKEGFTDFNEVLANGNSVDINYKTALLDFSLKFDIADFIAAKSKLASARIGYQLGLSKRGWGIDELNTSTVNNSPQDRLNQFYIMLALGFTAHKPVRK